MRSLDLIDQRFGRLTVVSRLEPRGKRTRWLCKCDCGTQCSADTQSLHNGEMPREIDHIDGNPANNRIDNLRSATHAQNLANTKRRRDNTSGYKGVRLHKSSGLWNARIKAGDKVHSLGYFKTAELAGAAYADAAAKYFGQFARVE